MRHRGWIHSTRSALLLVTFLVFPVLFAAAQKQAGSAGITNYKRIDATFACAGSTPVAAIEGLKKEGFKAIINFRTAEEQGAEIDASKAEAARLGLRYIHLPFRTPTNEIADSFLKAVADPANQPAFIHCAAGNRAAAMWLIKRLKIDGWDEARAVAEAQALGMTSPQLKEFAIQYAKTGQ